MSNNVTPDNDVKEVMDMVLGDYLAVFVESLEDQMKDGDITPEEQMSRFIRFSKGCRKICTTFGLDAENLDVDILLASELLCDYYKEDPNVGGKDSC